VISFDGETLQATVAIGETTAIVDATLIDTPATGDTILIHGGVALQKL
jgi:hydrogenase maturation factor